MRLVGRRGAATAWGEIIRARQEKGKRKGGTERPRGREEAKGTTINLGRGSLGPPGTN